MEAPTSFPKFTELPIELRLKIWNTTVVPRVVHITPGRTKAPSTLQVCRESREELSKRYKKIECKASSHEKDASDFASPVLFQAYIFPRADIVHLNYGPMVMEWFFAQTFENHSTIRAALMNEIVRRIFSCEGTWTDVRTIALDYFPEGRGHTPWGVLLSHLLMLSPDLKEILIVGTIDNFVKRNSVWPRPCDMITAPKLIRDIQKELRTLSNELRKVGLRCPDRYTDPEVRYVKKIGLVWCTEEMTSEGLGSTGECIYKSQLLCQRRLSDTQTEQYSRQIDLRQVSLSTSHAFMS